MEFAIWNLQEEEEGNEWMKTTTFQVRKTRTCFMPLLALKIYQEKIFNHLKRQLVRKANPLRFYVILYTMKKNR